MPEMPFHRSYQRSWILAAERLKDPFLYGCYHLLCMHMYDRRDGLPNNLRLLKNLLGISHDRKAQRVIDALVSQGLISISEDNVLRNQKAERELAKFAQKSAKNRENFAQDLPKNGGEKPMNSTRAHDRAQSRYLEDRIQNPTNGRGNSSSSEPAEFGRGLQQRIDAYKRQQEIGHATQSHQARDLGSPATPGKSDSQAQGHD